MGQEGRGREGLGCGGRVGRVFSLGGGENPKGTISRSEILHIPIFQKSDSPKHDFDFFLNSVEYFCDSRVKNNGPRGPLTFLPEPERIKNEDMLVFRKGKVLIY